jgi:hypothetical protein
MSNVEFSSALPDHSSYQALWRIHSYPPKDSPKLPEIVHMKVTRALAKMLMDMKPSLYAKFMVLESSMLPYRCLKLALQC